MSEHPNRIAEAFEKWWRPTGDTTGALKSAFFEAFAAGAAAGLIVPPGLTAEIREAIELAFKVADGTTATTDEWPSDEWRAAFVANFGLGEG